MSVWIEVDTCMARSEVKYTQHQESRVVYLRTLGHAPNWAMQRKSAEAANFNPKGTKRRC